MDLQGISRKKPRGLLRKAFDDCVMFHLLAMFPHNAAEQERYYLTYMLKKPQHVGMHQFVSLCSLWSNSTHTLRNYHAGFIAPVSSPTQLWQMFCSLRLIWQVMFYGCAHLRGMTNSTFTRKV